MKFVFNSLNIKSVIINDKYILTNKQTEKL